MPRFLTLLAAGTILQGKYIIERVVGQGGMGTVYLARQTTLGDRRVAIKETTLTLADRETREQAAALFRREAEILASIEHQNLVDVKDYFEDGASRYIVMAFIDGETLEEVLERSVARLRVDQVLSWIDQICDVLTALHEHDPPVFVRDLKPSNVMLDHSGRIRLIDFGIARLDRPEEDTSPLIKGVGTAGFAPFEQLTGTTDARSDIYALGATLHALLTSTRPPSSAELATGKAELTPPSQSNRCVSPQLDAAVMRMMAADPDARYQNVREARKALAAARATIRIDETAQETVARRRCANCGAATGDSVGRCPQCWQELFGEEAEAAPSAAPVTAPSDEAAFSGPMVGIFVVLLVLAAILWFNRPPAEVAIPAPDASPRASATAVSTSQDYFPLASGYSWRYKTTLVSTGVSSKWAMKVLPPRSGDTLHAVEIDGVEGQFTEWYSNSDGWIRKHRIQFSGGAPAIDYSPLMKYLQNPPREGTTWDWSGTGGMGQGSHRDKVEGFETIEVPAGKFRAARVGSEITQNGQSSTVTSWWAEGVGCVQSISHNGDLEYRSVLLEYKTGP